MATPESELYARGKKLLTELGNPPGISIEATSVYIGGGALPQKYIPSVAVVFDSSNKANNLLRKFRQCEPPVIGRIDDDRFMLDLKAIDTADYPVLIDAIKNIVL